MAKRNKEREDRINLEIIADAHDSEELAMGWYYYLEEKLTPFTAHCTDERDISPLQKDDEVEVSGLASADECQHEMFVMIRWEHKRQLAVPLAQLKPGADTDAAAKQAVGDWLYWFKQGYEF